MAENKIELRKLCAKDLFPMMKIVSKIKIREFKGCFDNINAGDTEDGLKTPETIIRRIGIEAAFNIADVVLTNIGCCENDVYSFFADLSGMKPSEIKHLEMSEFAEMFIQLVMKEEFKDFFTVVSRLMPKEK